jgi:HAD superfamily hydrolase (TIGR01509 family)
MELHGDTALKALIWDLDGTLAETEREGHLAAFNGAFEALDLPWRWDLPTYARLLRIAGGRERLMHDLARRPEAPVLLQERLALVERIHAAKNRLYARRVAEGRLRLRPGVLPLLRQCRAEGVRLAIATTTSRVNLQALIAAQLGPQGSAWFEVAVCGDDVRSKKPDPEVYLRVLEALRLPPLACVAIEDSPGGAAAARAADLPVVVTRSEFFPDDTIDAAIAIGPGLDRRDGWTPPPSPVDHAGNGSDLGTDRGTDRGITLDDLRHWQAQMSLVSQFG